LMMSDPDTDLRQVVRARPRVSFHYAAAQSREPREKSSYQPFKGGALQFPESLLMVTTDFNIGAMALSLLLRQECCNVIQRLPGRYVRRSRIP